nr:MAG TPA: hypothetical protein [Caudoviricetes sp.]DAV13993.1 MAG TPA: hypothetical protein [Caudoviricetes sp.]
MAHALKILGYRMHRPPTWSTLPHRKATVLPGYL